MLKNLKNILLQTKTQILILILLVLISYGNILQNGFAWDDFDFFYDWFAIKDSTEYSSLLALPDLIAGDLPEGHRGVYRPVRSVYYLFSYKLFGSDPLFYHLNAITIHLLIVIIVYFTSNLLTQKKLASFISAAAFSTHPIHTEAITFTAASMDTLGILLFFASFYFYLRARILNSEKKLTTILSALLGLLAFLTYEMTLVLPLVILAYEFVFKHLTIKNFLKNTPLLFFFLSLCVYTLVRVYIFHIGNRADYLGHWYIAASNQAKISIPEYYLIYAKLMLFPANLTIAHNLPQFFLAQFSGFILSRQDPDKWLELLGKCVIFFPILVNFLCLLTSYILFRRSKVILFSFFFFFIPLLTVSNILPQGAALAERFTYISSFGFCLALGFIADWLFTSRWIAHSPYLKAFLTILLMLLLVFYIHQTINRNLDWKNGETIMESALRVNPRSFIAQGALGVTKLRYGKYDEAIMYLESALGDESRFTSTKIYLGVAYRKKGDLNKAISLFKEVIQTDPTDSLPYSYLGSTYLETDEPEKAIEPYRQAVLLNPKEAYNYFNLATAYVRLKRYREATEAFNQALSINRYFTEARVNAEYKKNLEKNATESAQFYQSYISSKGLQSN